MHSTELPKPTPCPSCGQELEASTHKSGHLVEPDPDDISICFTCGAVNQYNTDMTLRSCDLDALTEMPPIQKAEIRRLSARVKAFRLSRKPG